MLSWRWISSESFRMFNDELQQIARSVTEDYCANGACAAIAAVCDGCMVCDATGEAHKASFRSVKLAMLVLACLATAAFIKGVTVASGSAGLVMGHIALGDLYQRLRRHQLAAVTTAGSDAADWEQIKEPLLAERLINGQQAEQIYLAALGAGLQILDLQLTCRSTTGQQQAHYHHVAVQTSVSAAQA